MFLLSAQNYFNIILSSYVEGQVKKNFKPEFYVFFRPPKSGCFFEEFTVEQVLKSFPGRTNSLKSPVFGFFNIVPFGLEESRKLRALIRWVWG